MTISERALSMAIAIVALIALFVPLERAFTARRQSHFRREIVLDLSFFAFQYLVMMTVLLAFNEWLRSAVGLHAPAAIVSRVRAMPLAAQALLAVVSGDFVLYWAHRASHDVPLFWRFHAVHHTATRLDWLAAHREHPLDGMWSQLWLNLPAFLLGVKMQAIVPVFVFRGVWAVFVHSNVRVPLGPLGFLLGDPVLHRWHHAKVDRTRHNFANLAPYLDWIFGTHFRPDHEQFELGIDAAHPSHLPGQLVEPFAPRLYKEYAKRVIARTSRKAGA